MLIRGHGGFSLLLRKHFAVFYQKNSMPRFPPIGPSTALHLQDPNRKFITHITPPEPYLHPYLDNLRLNLTMAIEFLRWHSMNPAHLVTYSTATFGISIIAFPLNKRTFEEEESQSHRPATSCYLRSDSYSSRHDVPATNN